jgi:hypothetical protein
MSTNRVRICRYGAPESASQAGCSTSVSKEDGSRYYAGHTAADLYSGLVRWISNDFSWNKRDRYFWLDLDTANEINKNTEWQSGPNDATGTDAATNFNGAQFDPKTSWGDKEQSGRSSRAEWKQSKSDVKMQLMMGDGEDGNKRNKSEGVQTGVVGIHCGILADKDNSGSYANSGYDHVYLLYRIDAPDDLLEEILDQLGRAQTIYTAALSRTVNPKFATTKWQNKLSTRRILQFLISHFRNGVVTPETQPDSLFAKLEAGELTSEDVFNWAVATSFGHGIEPRDMDISIIKRIIKWILSNTDGGQSRQEMMMLAELTTPFPAETRAPFQYTWNEERRDFVCRRISQHAMEMVFLLDLRANAILWHLDSDGSGGFLGYNRALRFSRCSPIYAYQPDNIDGKLFDYDGNGRTAYKVPAPYKAFVHKGPGQTELYADTRDWPYEDTIPGLQAPPS